MVDQQTTDRKCGSPALMISSNLVNEDLSIPTNEENGESGSKVYDSSDSLASLVSHNKESHTAGDNETLGFPESDFDFGTTMRNIFEDDFDLDIQAKFGRLLESFTPHQESSDLAYERENLILKHFFENLVLKVDANVHSPWEKLILRYCSYEVARSCFISLASMHLYQEGDQKNEEMYNLSMRFLEKVKLEIGKATSELNIHQEVSACKSVLVLIYVYILHCILDNGISKDCCFYFITFANICKSPEVLNQIFEDDQMKVLVAVLSWYDCVATFMSSENRVLACNPKWFGTKDSDVSTLKIMGCPSEIFEVLANICQLRSSIHNGVVSTPQFADKLLGLIPKVTRYREYIVSGGDGDLLIRIKCAQCWSIAVYLAILRLICMVEPSLKEFSQQVPILVNEFLDVFLTLDPSNRAVSQLVFPMYLVGCSCEKSNREWWIRLYDGLYAAAHSGALKTLRKAVEQEWNSLEQTWDGDLLFL